MKSISFSLSLALTFSPSVVSVTTDCPTFSAGLGVSTTRIWLPQPAPGEQRSVLECIQEVEDYRDTTNSSVNGASYETTAYSWGVNCSAEISMTDSSGTWSEGFSCMLCDPSAGGDPLVTGLKGQVFKFEGISRTWYSNLATDNLHWNMRFKKYETCPEGENMFISSVSFSSISEMENELPYKVLITATPKPIPECRDTSTVCLGGGMLHISFDGGKTFLSKPDDYHFGSRSRLVALNTYAACSRKWFDYQLTDDTNKKSLRNGRVTLVEKKPLQFLLENNSTMINPTECSDWIKERQENNDLFRQRGLWSTIYIETPSVSFHIEFRQSNPEKEDRKCDFQSLDSWMSSVSHELQHQNWNGILGETRRRKFDPITKEQIKSDRSILLRGKDDADYEVDGPFGTEHSARFMAES